MNIPLPSFIEQEAWSEFVQMRKKIKKPLTEGAAKRALKKLYELRDLGHDPNASLLQSADFYWQDLYEPKQAGFTKKAGLGSVQQGNTWLEEQERHRQALEDPDAKAKIDAARREALQKLKHLKRVA